MASNQTFSDQEIVDGIRSGRGLNESIRRLYRNYFDSLAWYVMNNSGSRQDAEDNFQEAVISFVEMVQNDKFRGESSIKTFLFSLNRHIWLNELKRRGRALKREEKYERGQEQSTADVSGLIVERETKDQVVQLMGELGDTCKQILLLFYYENFSISEIFETLHYENEQVVRNKKYKCLKQLEQMISADPALKQNLKNLLNG